METKGLNVGDLITAYHKGFHRVVGFEYYDGTQKYPLCRYITVLDSGGHPVKSKTEKTCHIDYCTKLDKSKVTELYNKEAEQWKLREAFWIFLRSMVE